MDLGRIGGITLGVKLSSGRFKPKYGIGGIVSIIFMVFLIIVTIYLLTIGIINNSLDSIVIPIFGIFSCCYLLMISPYTQRRKNYYIEFQNENLLDGFKLTYKNKLVDIKYKIDQKGKIAFADNNNKLSCISYADGSKMRNITKYKIMNYFGRWLNDNKLLSDEVTTTYEEL